MLHTLTFSLLHSLHPPALSSPEQKYLSCPWLLLPNAIILAHCIWGLIHRFNQILPLYEPFQFYSILLESPNNSVLCTGELLTPFYQEFPRARTKIHNYEGIFHRSHGLKWWKWGQEPGTKCRFRSSPPTPHSSLHQSSTEAEVHTWPLSLDMWLVQTEIGYQCKTHWLLRTLYEK